MAWNGTTRERYRRNAERYESDLTDGEWSLVEPLPPPPSQLDRPQSTDLRKVPDAIRYMLATGCRWRAVPKCSAPVITVRDHFHPWRGMGVLERITDAPPDLARDRAGRGPEPTAAGTGRQPVRTTETAGPSGYDAGKKARGRRRHIAVDVEGTPIVVQAHTADVRNRDGAPAVTKVWADSGCSGAGPRARLAETGVPEVPGIVERTRGFTVPCRRWAVECAFAWMSRCRRLAKDSGRSLAGSVAWAQLAACRFLFRRLGRNAGV